MKAPSSPPNKTEKKPEPAPVTNKGGGGGGGLFDEDEDEGELFNASPAKPSTPDVRQGIT